MVAVVDSVVDGEAEAVETGRQTPGHNNYNKEATATATAQALMVVEIFMRTIRKLFNIQH